MIVRAASDLILRVPAIVGVNVWLVILILTIRTVLSLILRIILIIARPIVIIPRVVRILRLLLPILLLVGVLMVILVIPVVPVLIWVSRTRLTLSLPLLTLLWHVPLSTVRRRLVRVRIRV